MLVTLGANDTREGIRKVYVVLVGVALKSNCLIHNSSWGWSHLDSFYYLSWQVMQPPIQFGLKEARQVRTTLLHLF